MYFVRSGLIALTTSSLRYTEFSGFFWSTTSYPTGSNYALYLYFSSANALPSNNDTRWLGFSLRCLAKTSLCTPMYFVRSGYVNLSHGSLKYAGFVGDPWSTNATPADSRYTFALGFNSAYVYPSDSSNRWYGFSLPASDSHLYNFVKYTTIRTFLAQTR